MTEATAGIKPERGCANRVVFARKRLWVAPSVGAVWHGLRKGWGP